MLDFFNLPTGSKGFNQQIFVGDSATAGASWYSWQKPRGINMINIFMLGGGGGGGGGAAGGTTGAGGGGGGASGNQYNFLFPAALLPDILYFSVGNGGTGGTGAAGGTGIATYASIYPATTVNYLLGIVSGGGGGAAGTAGGTTGSGGNVTGADILTSAPLASLGISLCTATAGNISLTGQAGSLGVLPQTGLCVTGGGFGGQSGSTTPTSGSNGIGVSGIIAGSIFPTLVGGAGASTGAGAGAPGAGGFNLLPKIRFFYGGAGGGGASGGATGSAGGPGSYGCGGGGSGGTTLTSQFGKAGDGGPGLVIVSCF